MGVTRLQALTMAVTDLDATLEAWLEGSEYRLVDRRPLQADLAAAWGLAPASHEVALTAAPGSERGWVRLVGGAAEDMPGPVVRRRGPMAIEFFARDDAEVHARFARLGVFAPITSPIYYDLSSIGSGEVESSGFRGPGGITLFVSTMKRVAPPRVLPVVPDFLGPAINMPIAAPEAAREASNAFYTDLVGMPVRFDGYVRDADVNRIMGAPDDWGYHITVFSIGDGQMAEHHFHPADRLLQAQPKPVDRLVAGAVGATYLARDLEAIGERLRAAGHACAGPIRPAGPPYDGRPTLVVRGPNTELVELVGVSLEEA